MLVIKYSKRAIGIIRRLDFSDLFLHPAYIRDTVERVEASGYVAVAWGDNGRKWPVVLLWRGREQMLFPDGYRLEETTDIHYNEDEALNLLMQLRKVWRLI